MKSPLEVVPQHRQLFPKSCIAWSLELLLKVHGRIGPDEYPFQSETKQWGYDAAAIGELSKRGVTAEHWHDPDNFAAFVQKVTTALPLGICPVFTIPTLLYFDVEAMEIKLDCHAFTATRDGPELAFLTWNTGLGRPSRVPVVNMRKIYQDWYALSTVTPELRGSLMNCLLGRLDAEVKIAL